MFTDVSLGRAQIWRSHTESYKFLLDILVNNSSAENHTDLTLGQVGLFFVFLFFVLFFFLINILQYLKFLVSGIQWFFNTVSLRPVHFERSINFIFFILYSLVSG